MSHFTLCLLLLARVSTAARIEILGRSNIFVQGGDAYSDDAVCNSLIGDTTDYNNLRRMKYCARIAGNVESTGIALVGLPENCSAVQNGANGFNAGECEVAVSPTQATCNTLPPKPVNVSGQLVQPTCRTHALNRDGSPIPCPTELIRVNGTLVPFPCAVNDANIFNIGNYTVQYCSERRCVPQGGVTVCTCVSSDTCTWTDPLEQGNTACTRNIAIRDTRPPRITLIGPDLVENFEAGRGRSYEDPGATALDNVDGQMFYYEPNCRALGTRSECERFTGASGLTECDWRDNITNTITTAETGNEFCSAKPCNISTTDAGQLEGNPGSICRITFGSNGSFTYNRRLVGNQTLVYLAIDTSRNNATARRIIQVVDTTPPELPLSNRSFDWPGGQRYDDDPPIADDAVDLNITFQSGRGPMEEGAPIQRDIFGNCQRQTDKPDFWSDNPFYAGQCVGTIRAHSQIVELPSYELVPRIPALQHIDYKVTDSSFNSRPNASHNPQLYRRVLRLTDAIPPELTLLGNDTIFLEGGEMWYEPFASCVDNLDGECTAAIDLEIQRETSLQCRKNRGCDFSGCAPVNPDLPCDATRVSTYAPAGTLYALLYSVSDRAGNVARLRRNVTIIDTRSPVLRLAGNDSMAVEGGAVFNEPGARAFDELDDDDTLTSRIDIRCINCADLTRLRVSRNGSNVDTTAAPFTVFKLSYNVTDDAGNPAQTIYRDVIIRDSTPPALSLPNGTTESMIHQAGTKFLDSGVIAVDILDSQRYGPYVFSPRDESRIRATVDRQAVRCDATSEYMMRLPSDESEGVCRAVAPPCNFPTEYESATPTQSSDRICSPVKASCGGAGAAVVEAQEPTPTTDRLCINCPAGNGIASSGVVNLSARTRHQVKWDLAHTGIVTIIETGDEVIWKWNSGSSLVNFSIVSGAGGVADGIFSSPSSSNSSFSHRFANAGVFPYFNGWLSDHSATIVVREAGKMSHQVLITATGFTPLVLNAGAGDTVSWTWHGSALQTGIQVIDTSGVVVLDSPYPAGGGGTVTKTLAGTGQYTVRASLDISISSTVLVTASPSNTPRRPVNPIAPVSVQLAQIEEDSAGFCGTVSVLDLMNEISPQSQFSASDGILVYDIISIRELEFRETATAAATQMLGSRGNAPDAQSSYLREVLAANADISDTDVHDLLFSTNDGTSWVQVRDQGATLTEGLYFPQTAKLRLAPQLHFAGQLERAYHLRLWNGSSLNAGQIVQADVPTMLEVDAGRLPQSSAVGLKQIGNVAGVVSIQVDPRDDAPELLGPFSLQDVDEDESFDGYIYSTIAELISSVYYDPDGPSNIVASPNSVGVAVVGADTEYGDWSWSCSTLASGPFTLLNVSKSNDESATLLSGACRLRFEPKENFNSETDANGTPRKNTDAPSVTLLAWDPLSSATTTFGFVAGSERISIPAKSNRGRHGDAFGRRLVQGSVRVFALEDAPTVGNPDTAYRTTFVEGEAGVPIVDLLSTTSVVYADSNLMTAITIEMEDTSNGESELLTFSNRTMSKNGISLDTSNDGGTLVFALSCNSSTPSGFRCPVTGFDEVVRSIRYRNTAGNPTVGERRLTIRATDSRLIGPISTTIMNVIAVNSRPVIDADSHPDIHGFVSYSPSDNGMAIATASTVSDRDNTVIRLSAKIVDQQPDDNLEFVELPTGFSSVRKNNVFLVTGNGSDVEWSRALRTLHFSTAVPGTSSIRQIILETTDMANRRSLPTSIFVVVDPGSAQPWVDLNGARPGLDIDGSYDIIYEEGDSFVDLGLSNAFMVAPGAGSIIERLRLVVGRAVDLPYESITCDQPSISAAGLISVNDQGDASFTISGNAPVQVYSDILRTCSYTNTAAEPTVTLPRIVKITATRGQSESAVAHIVVKLLSRNDAPRIYPDANPSAMTVPQGIPDSLNQGVTIGELIGDSDGKSILPRQPDKAVNIVQYECGPNGCDWEAARDVCYASSMSLCSREEIRAGWNSLSVNEFVSPTDDITSVRAWTSDLSDDDPIGEFSQNLTDTRNTIIDLGFDTASAWVLDVTYSAISPRFQLTRRNDSSGGIPFVAACCNAAESRKIHVDIHERGIAGGFTISQASPHHAVMMVINLRGVRRLASDGTERPVISRMAIHEYDLPPPDVASVSGRSVCDDTGPVFDPDNGDCGNLWSKLCYGGTIINTSLHSICCKSPMDAVCLSAVSADGNRTCSSPNSVDCLLPSGSECAAGRLSSRHGLIGVSTEHNQVIVDGSITLYGNRSVLGRALVLYDERDRRVICRSISIPELVNTKVAQLQDPTMGNGATLVVSVAQIQDQPSTPTRVRMWTMQPASTLPRTYSLSLGHACQSTVISALETFSLTVLGGSGYYEAATNTPLSADSAVRVSSQSGGSSSQNSVCAQLKMVYMARSLVSSKGTIGSVNFNQLTSGGVQVKIDLKTTRRRADGNYILADASFSVHLLSTSRSDIAGQFLSCASDVVGPIFDIRCNDTVSGQDESCNRQSTSERGNPGSRQLLGLGDGLFAAEFVASELQLNGPTGILGRSFVLKPVGSASSEWICGTINDVREELVAEARFVAPRVAGADAQLLGSITVHQPVGNPRDAFMDIRLRMADSSNQPPSTVHWSIRESSAPFGCGLVGSIYGAGDLESRHGALNLASSAFLRDSSVALEGPNSVSGRSIAIFRGNERLACATIEPVRTRIVTASISDGRGRGTVTLTQKYPGSQTIVDVRLQNVARSSRLVITDSAPALITSVETVPRWNCTDISIDAVYNPIVPASSGPMVPNSRPSCGDDDTRDNCRVGDLGNLLDTSADETIAYRTAVLTDLPLFGPMAVGGRGIALIPAVPGNTGRASCAPLEFSHSRLVAEAVFVDNTAAGTFTGTVVGSISLSRRADSPAAETIIRSTFQHVCMKQDVRFSFDALNLVQISPTKLGRFGPVVYQSPIESANACAQLCTTFTNCSYWSWASPKSTANLELGYFAGDCYLLTAGAGSTSVETSGFISGQRGCPRQATSRYSWYITNSNECLAASSPHNPQALPLDSTILSALSCPVGNLSCKHGDLSVPTLVPARQYSDVQLSLDGPDSVIGMKIVLVDTSMNVYSCAEIRQKFDSSLDDDDVNSFQGIAVTSTQENFGHYEIRDNTATRPMWNPFPPALRRSSALLLSAGSRWSIRFVPDSSFVGRITCSACPPNRTNLDCVPCPLDRKAGEISYAGWDGTFGSEGERQDSSFAGPHGAFSEYVKTIDALVLPATINGSAPNGTVYAVEYDVEDNVGNQAPTLARFVTIIDSQAPKVSLRGPHVFIQEAGIPFTDPGAVAHDFRDGDVTASVRVASIQGTGSFAPDGTALREAVDPANRCNANGQFSYIPPYLGDGRFDHTAPNGSTFNITFSAMDGAGNIGFVSRSVVLIDSIPPELSQPTRAVALESTSTYQRSTFQYSDIPSSCPQARNVYLADEVHELGCIRAVDTLDGDVTCTANLVSVQKLPPNLDPTQEWSTSGPRVRFGLPYRVNSSCIARKSSASATSVDLECGAEYGGIDLIDPTEAVGTRYILSYSATDAADNRADSSVLLIVEDTEPPQFTLPDPEFDLLDYGSEFGTMQRLSGVFAFDSRDGNVTSAIVPGSETVNSVIPGQYTITYSVEDLMGNLATVSRNITISENSATGTLKRCPDGGCTCGCVGGMGKATVTFRLSGITVADFNVPSIHNSLKYTIASAVRSDYRYMSASRVIKIDAADDVSNDGIIVSVVVGTDTCDSSALLHFLQTLDVMDSVQSTLSMESAALSSVLISIVNSTFDDCGTASASSSANEGSSGWVAAVVLPILFLVAFLVVVYFRVIAKRKKAVDLEQKLSAGSTYQNEAFKDMLPALPMPQRPTKRRPKDDPDAPALPMPKRPTKRRPKDDPDAPALPRKGESSTDGPPRPRKKKGAGAFEFSDQEVYEAGESKEGFATHNRERKPVADDPDAPAPPPKRSNSSSFEFSDQEVYEAGDGRAGFATHNEVRPPKSVETGYIAVDPSPRDKSAFNYSDQEVYEAGDAKAGFATHNKERSPKRPSDPNEGYLQVSAPEPTKFDYSEQEVYEASDVKAGFATNNKQQKAQPPPRPAKQISPPRPSKPSVAVLPMESSNDELYEVGAEGVRPGFNAHDRGIRSAELQEIYDASAGRENDDAAPPLPSKMSASPGRSDAQLSSPSVLPMETSEEELYEVGSDAVKPGFNAHDRGTRSVELQEIYDASAGSTTMAPPQRPPKNSRVLPIEEDGLLYEVGLESVRPGFNVDAADDDAPPLPKKTSKGP